MVALGAYLLLSVATATPAAPVHAAERLASTYDEAACDASDGGECAVADAAALSLPQLPAILDCESPFIAEMIGSCDLPKPSLPSLHLPTVRNGGSGFCVAHGGGCMRLTVGAAPSSVDAVLPRPAARLHPIERFRRVVACDDTVSPDAPRSRLDRPPRA
jgi:hypothetical protein